MVKYKQIILLFVLSRFPWTLLINHGGGRLIFLNSMPPLPSFLSLAELSWVQSENPGVHWAHQTKQAHGCSAVLKTHTQIIFSPEAVYSRISTFAVALLRLWVSLCVLDMLESTSAKQKVDSWMRFGRWWACWPFHQIRTSLHTR